MFKRNVERPSLKEIYALIVQSKACLYLYQSNRVSLISPQNFMQLLQMCCEEFWNHLCSVNRVWNWQCWRIICKVLIRGKNSVPDVIVVCVWVCTVINSITWLEQTILKLYDQQIRRIYLVTWVEVIEPAITSLERR